MSKQMSMSDVNNHQCQNVTVLAILEWLEFKNFCYQSTMVASNTFHYYMHLFRRPSSVIADQINGFLNDQNSQFYYNQWCFIGLDVTETKLFKESRKLKSIPKYRLILNFKSKAFDFINLPEIEILRSIEVCDNLPSNCDISDIPW